MSSGEKVTISDKASAVLALAEELKSIEKMQLKIAAEMSALVAKQIELSKMARTMHDSMEKLLK